MICPECRSEIEPVMTVCPGCGARLGSGKRGEPDWREQVRETVARHKERRQKQQEKLEDEARQLRIFPEAVHEDEEERRARERRAEIRARVTERLEKRRPEPSPGAPYDAGEVAISGGGRGAATARQLLREPSRERDPYDPETRELEPEGEPDFDASLVTAEHERSGSGSGATPERGLLLELGLASAGERLLGGLIDVVFVALIQLTLFYLTTHLVAQRLDALPTSAIVAMSVVGSVLAAGYFLFFWGLSGQTLGKLLTGTRVVDRKGGALGFGRAGVRLVGTLLGVLPLFAGFIGLFSDPERRGWHDRLAGTKVVRG